MRKAGKVVAGLFEALAGRVKPGVSTDALDRFAEEYIRKEGAEPAFKGYRGYPSTICASVNDEVVHGIPDKRVLKEGDIVGIDVGAKIQGFYSDAARTFAVGKVDASRAKLIRVTREALQAGIEKARPGNRISDISNAVQSHAEKNGFQVVRDYVGHGIGTRLHEEPQVPNYGPAGEGPVIREGMALAIEPMVNAGGFQVKLESDGWTVRTLDGSPSAHFEDTVLITADGTENVTRYA